MSSFSLPTERTTSEGETALISWSVTDGTAAADVAGGECVITPQFTATPAQLTAVIRVLDASVTKTFDFTVAAINEDTEFVYYDIDFTKIGDMELEESEYADNIESPVISGSVGDAAYVRFADGEGMQFRTDGSSDADHLDVTVDVKSLANNQTDFQQLSTINVTEVSFEYMLNPGNSSVKPKTNMEFRDQNNNYIGRFSFVPNKIGFGISTYILAAETNKQPWTADGSFQQVYTDNGNRIQVDLRIEYDNVKNEVAFYAKLPQYQGDKGYDEYQLLLNQKYTVDTGAQQNIGRIKFLSMGSNFANIKSIKSYTTISGIRYGAQQEAAALDYMNGQSPDFVTSNLNLAEDFGVYGARMEWSVTPEGIIDNTGKLLRTDLTAEDRYEVTIQPSVVFDDPKYSLASFELEPTTVIVTGFNQDNLLRGQRVTLSGASAAEGSDAANLADGNLSSFFQSSGTEENLEVMIDLGTAKDLNQIRVWKGADSNIAEYRITLSADKTVWTEADEIEEGTENDLLTFAEGSYRYVKLEVLSKTTAGAPVSIAEIEGEFHPGDDYKAQQDIETVTVPDGVVREDFELEALGSIWGSAITWTSDKPDVLRIAEPPVNGMYQVDYTAPDTNTPVVLVASIGQYTRRFTVTAKGNGSNTGGGISGGGSGGGSGSSSGGGSSGSGMPYVQPENRPEPEQTPDTGSRYFEDVSGESAWAAEYIDALYEKEIVNGVGGSMFDPNASVSRAEFVKMLVLSLGIETDPAATVPFTDVPDSYWAYPYIAAAYQAGIVTGITDTEFGVDQPILRQDVAVMAQRALDAVGIALEQSNEPVIFTDAGEIDSYAAESVAAMQTAGILSGMPDGSFCPKDNTTRAESAKILYQMIQG